MSLARFPFALIALTSATALLAGCASSGSPLSPSTPSGEAIVVGSQQYYSSEIIAEIYSQALESEGFAVERAFNIGQREAYVPSLVNGELDLFPEYTGPLLQYWEPDTTLTASDEVYDRLVEVTPEGLQILDQAPATDQNSYVVTREFSEAYDVTSLTDLASVPVPIALAGNSEGRTRPNGPLGLSAYYGVDVSFVAIDDGGGPLTINALKNGDAQLAVVYTASPSISQDDLVVLEDPEGLFVASHVVPVASADLPEDAVAIIDRISAALTPEGLIALNVRSVDEQLGAVVIAADWIGENLT
jgi:osmoprotectant transport system substrate-binding protein